MSADHLPIPSPRPESLLRQYWTVLLLYNPLVTGAVCLAMSPRATFWRSFAVSLTIAVVTSSTSFVAVATVQALERRRARTRAPRATPHGRGWYLLWALAAMPVGLVASSEVTRLLFGFRAPAGLSDYRFAIFVGSSIAGVFFLWYSRRDAEHQARLAELRLEQAQAQTLQAQLSALTSQLNPHLLFNALNTVAALIQTEPDRAEQTVVRLAELYRGVLGATRRTEHTLEQELRICRAYLDVEQARFGERLAVSVELDQGLDVEHLWVPVLLLQPLVENAVTHGLASRARGGKVSISGGARGGELELSVRDDGVGFGNSPQRGAGLGVETTRRRLWLCYGREARLELGPARDGGTEALLRLPLRAHSC